MKDLLPQGAVERKAPAGMIAQLFHRLAIGHPFQVLQQTDPREQHRLNSGSAVVQAIEFFQLGAGRDQQRVNLRGEQAVSVSGAEELVGPAADREQRGLSSEVRQAHNGSGKGLDIRLAYRVA